MHFECEQYFFLIFYVCSVTLILTRNTESSKLKYSFKENQNNKQLTQF